MNRKTYMCGKAATTGTKRSDLISPKRRWRSHRRQTFSYYYYYYLKGMNVSYIINTERCNIIPHYLTSERLYIICYQPQK